uniref:ubiquitin carboxyl-terminal hydrolase 25 isoform X5 n=1 Tax=Ciona intestinalis TaxID=7719 RepID=UPI00089DC998|nr:ubiquitin carboxyl-terminal hydrolase 25 isoform X5 [Ciona intestinalis]|eukprot:XP_018667099.1 ubiquitin carboxyl-terminal hydrolase 25 isoform X5 [Ciona intestinalis]
MPDMTGRPRSYCQAASRNILDSDVSRLGSTVTHPINRMEWENQPQTSGNVPSADSEEDDLQKAIALSLQVSNDISMEPGTSSSVEHLEGDDLARALAESIADIQSRQPISGDASHRHKKDPHNLLRISKNWPVGLKNVGNSCWFSVVVQSLFHIPIFRNIILKFGPTEIDPSLNAETKRNLRLMQELRCLFALMITSNKSFLDPIKCVNILQEAFQTKSSDSQQDVSEFTHMLLDWLEDAFRHIQETTQENDRRKERNNEFNITSADDIGVISDLRGPQKPLCNPVQELFYGTSKTVGVNRHGIRFEQEHTFGILPLCVEGHKNLHESLEYATAKAHCETSQNGQEVWFTKLPPILTFQLSRFQFNQAIGKPEKIHNRLIFPSLFYMDRYMESNAQKTRARREEIKQLREELSELKLNLNQLSNFTANEKSYHVAELLSICAEYATSKSSSSNMDGNASCGRSRRGGTESPSNGLSPNKRSKEEEDTNSHHESRPPSATSSSSYMSSSSEEESLMVRNILLKWQSDVEKKIADIREKIEEIQMTIDKMFDDPNERCFPYSLHAVLVHQGQALAGHYWAYIKDYVNRRWLKFNDVAVTEETYDQLTSDSIGGVHSYRFYGNSASAYCLIYVDNRKMDLTECADDSFSAIASDPVLANLVNDHNQQLNNELECWDVERAKELSLKAEKREMESMAESSCKQNGAWNLTDLKNAVQKVGSTYNAMGPEKALEEAISEEMSRLQDLSQQSDPITSDSRLQNIAVYLYRNKAPRKVIERCVLEQFTDERLRYDRRASDIMGCAQEKLSNLSEEDLNEEKYQHWQTQYKSFCTSMCHLVDGMEMFRLRNFFPATQHFAAVYDHQFDPQEPQQGVDLKMLGRYCRISITRVHEEVMLKMQSPNEEDVYKGLKLMRKKLIPCISLLLGDGRRGKCDQDLQLADSIRGDWCSLLEQSVVVPRDTLSTALTDFLETNPNAKIKQRPPVTKLSNLCQRFEQVMFSFLDAEN